MNSRAPAVIARPAARSSFVHEASVAEFMRQTLAPDDERPAPLTPTSLSPCRANEHSRADIRECWWQARAAALRDDWLGSYLRQLVVSEEYSKVLW